MSKKLIQIGMDDIDSPGGGCTTHFASILVEKFDEMGVQWTDYPNLIRLNPGIPYRTRGNGAVALRFETDQNRIESIISMIERLLHDYVEQEYQNTNPGVVILEGEMPSKVPVFSQLALWRIVPIAFAKRIIQAFNITHLTTGNGRGLIGALAAVGNTLHEDHTYEYIGYRALENCHDHRGVDVESVQKMDEDLRDCVFSNVDTVTGRVIIEPHGPDPVLFGVRGESAECVIEAGKRIRTRQPVDRWMVFRSNQGTGEHLKHQVEIKHLRPYMAAIVSGIVSSRPKMIEGGHVIFSIADEEKWNIDCAAYEPSGEFREVVLELVIGDRINVHASVRPASRTHGLTLNLEGLEIKELAKTFKISNPICPECGKRMKSAGSMKGYKCVKCGHRNLEIQKIMTPITRDLHLGLYLPPERAQRHLTKPLVRVGKNNLGSLRTPVNIWHN